MNASLVLILLFSSLNLFCQDTASKSILLPKTFFPAGSRVNLYYENVNNSCTGKFELPSYSLGNNHLGDYLLKNTKQPGNLGEEKEPWVNGQLIISFVVNELGKIENVRMLSSPHGKVTESIIETVSKLKDFTPAKCNDKPIATRIYYVANFVGIF